MPPHDKTSVVTGTLERTKLRRFVCDIVSTRDGTVMFDCHTVYIPIDVQSYLSNLSFSVGYIVLVPNGI